MGDYRVMCRYRFGNAPVEVWNSKSVKAALKDHETGGFRKPTHELEELAISGKEMDAANSYMKCFCCSSGYSCEMVVEAIK